MLWMFALQRRVARGAYRSNKPGFWLQIQIHLKSERPEPYFQAAKDAWNNAMAAAGNNWRLVY